MCNIVIKSYRPGVVYSTPHFFILNKGNNSGKPLLSPCPNCFVIQFETLKDKELAYWVLYSLWQSRAFHPYLRGSVIPFVILKDVESCLCDGLRKAEQDPEQFRKMVSMLLSLEQIETQFLQKLKAIREARLLVLHSRPFRS